MAADSRVSLVSFLKAHPKKLFFYRYGIDKVLMIFFGKRRFDSHS